MRSGMFPPDGRSAQRCLLLSPKGNEVLTHVPVCVNDTHTAGSHTRKDPPNLNIQNGEISTGSRSVEGGEALGGDQASWGVEMFDGVFITSQ